MYDLRNNSRIRSPCGLLSVVSFTLFLKHKGNNCFLIRQVKCGEIFLKQNYLFFWTNILLDTRLKKSLYNDYRFMTNQVT
jgi:hypothetical protein